MGIFVVMKMYLVQFSKCCFSFENVHKHRGDVECTKVDVYISYNFKVDVHITSSKCMCKEEVKKNYLYS